MIEEHVWKWSEESPWESGKDMVSMEVTQTISPVSTECKMAWDITFHERTMGSDDMSVQDVERLIGVLQAGLNKIRTLI